MVSTLTRVTSMMCNSFGVVTTVPHTMMCKYRLYTKVNYTYTQRSKCMHTAVKEDCLARLPWLLFAFRGNWSTTPRTSLLNSTPLSAPRDRATPSQKRTTADANLHQPSTTPPAPRPVHIISETQLP